MEYSVVVTTGGARPYSHADFTVVTSLDFSDHLLTTSDHLFAHIPGWKYHQSFSFWFPSRDDYP